MASWLKLIGSARAPLTEAPFRGDYTAEDVGFRKAQKPGIRAGDRLFLYAPGGSRRIFALAEAIRDPERDPNYDPSQEGSCQWKVPVHYLINLPVASGILIDEIISSQRDLTQSLRQASHIKLLPEESDTAQRKLEAATPDRALVDSLVRPRSRRSGQSWGGSAECRKAVETFDMALALRHYSALWREVIDVSANRPFDLLCRTGDRELRVEVKGTTSRGLSVLLTRNEVRHAEANVGRMALFVVSEISARSASDCSGGIVRILEPWDIHQDQVDPIAFECRLRVVTA